MGDQPDPGDEKDPDGRRGRRGRSGPSPSTAGSILHSEGTHRARTLLRHPWNRRRGVGDECRSLGCRIEGCPPLRDLDEGRWRNRGEIPVETSILLSKLVLPASWIILKGTVSTEEGKKEEILERVKSYSEMRKRTQPLDYPSAGSIFKNPKEGPAGKWIEEAGLKGFRMGQAMVSERHANFIINLGKAKPKR